MVPQTSSRRFKLLATVLLLAGLGLTWPWSSPEGTAALQKLTFPKHVLILRHGEKPDDDHDPNLTSRGAARAAALPSLFLIPPTFPTKSGDTLPTPDFIFATKKSKKSNRPVETVTPLAKALGDMHIHDKHEDDDFQGVADRILGDDKFAGKTVLICWHHGKMHKLAVAVVAKAKNAATVQGQIPKHVEDSEFDRLWHITFDAGQATFVNRPQRLLFKDRPE
jgi:hypothetical protein